MKMVDDDQKYENYKIFKLEKTLSVPLVDFEDTLKKINLLINEKYMNKIYLPGVGTFTRNIFMESLNTIFDNEKNNQIYNFAKKIINYPRSLSGKGVRETLKEIKKIVPNLKIKSFKSGKKVFDWKIPLEWEVKNAFIITPDGKKICNYDDNKLH